MYSGFMLVKTTTSFEKVNPESNEVLLVAKKKHSGDFNGVLSYEIQSCS